MSYVNLLPDPSLVYDIVMYNRYDGTWQNLIKSNLSKYVSWLINNNAKICLEPEIKFLLSEFKMNEHYKYPIFMELLMNLHKNSELWRYQVEKIAFDMAVEVVKTDWECWINMITNFVSDLSSFGPDIEESYRQLIARRRWVNCSVQDANNELRIILKFVMYYLYIQNTKQILPFIARHTVDENDKFLLETFKTGIKKFLGSPVYMECTKMSDVISKLEKMKDSDMESKIHLHFFLGFLCAYNPVKCTMVVKEYNKSMMEVSVRSENWKTERGIPIGDSLIRLARIVCKQEKRKMMHGAILPHSILKQICGCHQPLSQMLSDENCDCDDSECIGECKKAKLRAKRFGETGEEIETSSQSDESFSDFVNQDTKKTMMQIKKPTIIVSPAATVENKNSNRPLPKIPPADATAAVVTKRQQQQSPTIVSNNTTNKPSMASEHTPKPSLSSNGNNNSNTTVKRDKELMESLYNISRQVNTVRK